MFARSYGFGRGGAVPTATGNTQASFTAVVMVGERLVPASTSTNRSQAASNDADQTFPLFQTDITRNITIAFPAGWNGGNGVASNGDVSETIVAVPNTTVTGTAMFAPGVDITVTFDGGADSSNATIKYGKALGLNAALNGAIPFGIVTVNGVSELGTFDASQNAVTVTTAPDGSKVFVVSYSASKDFADVGHTHSIG